MATLVAAGTNAGAFVDTLVRDPLLTAVRGTSPAPVAGGTDAVFVADAAGGGGVAAASAPPALAFGDCGTGLALGFAAGDGVEVAGVVGVDGVAGAAAAAAVAVEAGASAAAAVPVGPLSFFGGGVDLHEQKRWRKRQQTYKKVGVEHHRKQ